MTVYEPVYFIRHPWSRTHALRNDEIEVGIRPYHFKSNPHTMSSLLVRSTRLRLCDREHPSNRLIRTVSSSQRRYNKASRPTSFLLCRIYIEKQKCPSLPEKLTINHQVNNRPRRFRIDQQSLFQDVLPLPAVGNILCSKSLTKASFAASIHH